MFYIHHNNYTKIFELHTSTGLLFRTWGYPDFVQLQLRLIQQMVDRKRDLAPRETH